MKEDSLKFYFGDTGSGDYVEITHRSIDHRCLHLCNDSIGKHKFVVYKADIDNLIKALVLAKTYL